MGDNVAFDARGVRLLPVPELEGLISMLTILSILVLAILCMG
jgi:hypothetical protein